MFRAVFHTTLPSFRASASAFASPSTFSTRRWLSQEARSKIQQAVSSTPVVLFMKGTPQAPQCGFSRAAVQILDLHGVPIEKLQTYDVLEDSELRSGIKEFSEWPTIPQVYINGEFIGGCDILLSMHQSGELEELLEKKGIIPPVAEENAEASASSSS